MSLKQVLRICTDIFGESTIHGISRVIKSNSVLSKLVWALCFLISAGYCFYLIATGIGDYLQYDTVVDMAYNSEIPISLPAITICNSNQFQTNISFQFANQQQFDGLENLQKYLVLIDSMNGLNDTLKSSFSYNLNETLISCHFNNEICTFTDFKRVFIPFTGNCFSFSYDSNNLKRISRIGKNNGFSIELFIGDPRLIPNFIQTTGFKVFINNQSYILNELLWYDIATGLETNIIINRVFIKKQPHPYNECIKDSSSSFDSELFRTIIAKNITYTQSYCHNLCYQQEVIRECGCYAKSFDKLNSLNPCLNQSQFICATNEYKKFLLNLSKICTPYCPLECDSMIFQITTTTTGYPSFQYSRKKLMNNSLIQSKFPNENLTYDLIKQSVLSLNVFYGDLSYMEYNQRAKITSCDLVSNIGGILGVFIGASFLSILEIFEVLVDVLNFLFSKTKVFEISKP